MLRVIIRWRSGMGDFTNTDAQILDFALEVITPSVCICLRTFRFGDRLEIFGPPLGAWNSKLPSLGA
jgi:hypothetical protein